MTVPIPSGEIEYLDEEKERADRRRWWRWHFAGQLMAVRVQAGTISGALIEVNNLEPNSATAEERAEWAVEEADALIAELEKGEGIGE
jgi:hypothetical protein